MPNLTKRASRDDVGKTVGSILKNDFSISSGMLKKLKNGCLISVNGSFARTNQLLLEGDVVCAALDGLLESSDAVLPENTPLDILYEDETLIALNKPSNTIVHPSTTRGSGTVANGLAWHFLATGHQSKIHPVSRLDRDTTGVILFAKDSHTKQLMSAAMKRHEFGKEYIAIVRGRPSTEAGAIELPISRVPGSIMLRGVDCSGKWAKTYFTVIASSLQWSLVKLYPVTGRTHQIRVHMAAIGCPLLADSLYGPESAAGAAGSDETAGGTPGAAGASGSTDAATAAVAAVADETAGMPAAMRRQALHAWRISFAHPYSNLQITIKAPPPQDFLRAAAHLLCYALL